MIIFGYKFLLKAFYPIKYEDIVSKDSETYGVEKELIYAIIKCESGFDENARSPADAVGLMQITPDTFKWLQKYIPESHFGEDELKNPEVNIAYGTLLISILRKKYSTDETVLSAYNAGETVVKRWLSDKNVSKDGVNFNTIPYKETRDYVNRVKTAKKIYKKLHFEG